MSAPLKRKTLLVILDGWGIAEDPSVSAPDNARVPFYHELLAQWPHTWLLASEQAVGLPAGQMGNSEVGHMNLGAGRVVYQELERISTALRDGSLAAGAPFRQVIEYCKIQQKPLHLLGLLSDGGVHSHIDHLLALLPLLKAVGLTQVYIHVFTDGRDTDPRSGLVHLQRLQDTLAQVGIGQIASVCGRYYAMDRDKRWERTRRAWDLLVQGIGQAAEDPLAAVRDSYARGVTDEFLESVVITRGGNPLATIHPGDACLFFNFRTDRGRQLTTALTQASLPEYGMHTLPLQFTTFTRYDDTWQGVQVLFEKDTLPNMLGQVLSRHGVSQIRIAETEKYPHVTFFFNGGVETPYPGEERILIPSPRVATYDLQPQMSAPEIRDAIVPRLQEGAAGFVCLNFANPDMVGHTGVWEAAIAAVETVDSCNRDVISAALQAGYTCIILADHGNCDRMKNPDGSPHTAHTLAKVPCILVGPDAHRFALRPGKLGDIAPTLLSLMGLPVPAEMTGEVLVTPR
ncbi:MAG: 2,3-bisphosphoglycerate-independent phosphoglycerate mutase [Bacteroidetes bacterium]|nr:2,3-bisphosphoglycerate-independent phosphoglycerate mutase [Bacteroidota bacterium]